jgi:hypothetical protein
MKTLLGEPKEVLELKRTAHEDILERFPFDEFHDDVGAVLVDAVVKNGDDIGMLEAGGGHGLAPGLLDEPAVVLGDLHPDALDRDRAIEMVVPGPVNIAETAAANQFPNFEAVGNPALRGRIRGRA